MNLTRTLEWIESTDLSTAIREGALLYPIIGGFHLLAIALFGGMLVLTDLRLLGWALQRRTPCEVIAQFRPWKRVGFVLIVASSLLLSWAEPIKLFRSPSFWIKMVLMVLVAVHAWVFWRSVYSAPPALDKQLTFQAKLGAIISLLLWAGLVFSGRLIAFDA
jgi:hypothetical protein